MARSRVTLNGAGIRELLRSPAVAAVLRSHAEPVLAAAKADPHDDTGAYESGLHIEERTSKSRVVVRVVSGDFKGHILEAKYGILARALDSA